jgi:hypothetical protein
MNRQQRRAAVSGDTLRDHRIMQVHEAGHAIGRILAAEAYAIAVEESVISIVVRIGIATTYGPMFQREVQDELREHIEAAAANGKMEVAPVFAIMAIEKARKQVADIEGWLKARLVHIVMGPCAEAKLTGRDPFEVFKGVESSGNWEDANSACNYASIGRWRSGELIAEALEHALALLEQPNVWRAVLAVADLVPRRGTLPGSKIIPVAMAALTDADIKSDEIGDLADCA